MAGKTIKLDIGTIYKKTDNGSYFFRYQINGQRKAVSLQTKNQKEAIAKAEKLIPVVKATTTEVISAHVKHARGLASRKKSLPLTKVWEVYARHPERATPATISEQNSCVIKKTMYSIRNSIMSTGEFELQVIDSVLHGNVDHFVVLVPRHWDQFFLMRAKCLTSEFFSAINDDLCDYSITDNSSTQKSVKFGLGDMNNRSTSNEVAKLKKTF